MDARLKVVGGPLSGQSIRLARKLLIGRAEDCDLRIDSDFVSWYHCILLRDEHSLRLRELGSKNGTFVNGCRIGTNAIVLLHDDNVCIGEINFLVDLSPATEPTSSPLITEASSTGTGGFANLDDEPIPADDAAIIPPGSDPVHPPQREEDGDA
jgi:pSer/pThr/pTyr-binding forkhead associated (FHA) protein